MVVKKALVEVFSTMNGKVFQDNQKLCYVLEWYGEKTHLKLPCFFGLKKRVDALDLEAMLNNASSYHDFEILAPCGCDRCFVLSIPEIIEFKDLLSGARVMMELNSMLYERLHRPVLCA